MSVGPKYEVFHQFWGCHSKNTPRMAPKTNFRIVYIVLLAFLRIFLQMAKTFKKNFFFKLLLFMPCLSRILHPFDKENNKKSEVSAGKKMIKIAEK